MSTIDSAMMLARAKRVIESISRDVDNNDRKKRIQPYNQLLTNTLVLRKNDKQRKRHSANPSSTHIRLLLLGCLFGSLGNLTLTTDSGFNGLDNTDSDSLSHVTNGETTKWGEV